MRGKFSSPTLKVNITPERWETAVKASSGGCLISDAIRDAYPHLSSVSTDMATIRVSDKKKGLRYTYLTPDKAQTLLLAFDQGWALPDDHRVLVKTAVKTTKIMRRKTRASQRSARLAELKAKAAQGTLTPHEKSALTTMLKNPDRPSSEGKAEAAKDPANRTVHGRTPRTNKKNPNLLAGRDRQFGKKVARPSVLFEAAVQKAVEERLEQEMG